ncbi:LysR substrate-binding domain-containing protein [Avibacterium sp. 21-586]|uniref:LysR family transcriptional regulator n=1 Tax=Avibacterium sp. 21-586 TaxID=2911534 RepID=UPI002245F841|nr:LysR family transcriptional regulator [Avibacterium sp. 21-586]MCW9709745.1 LysR substrate-binding domain-containing protein [Avibacterium sp. 21-586]
MQQIDLNDMRFFVTVIQSGSLTQAAEQLNVPKSRLSRRLTELENQLGSKLLDRNRNGTRLNDLGEHFYQHALIAMEAAESAVNSVADCLAKPHGLLRISVSSEILRYWLTPHLSHYVHQHPDVELNITMENRRANLLQEGVDIALRIGELDLDDVVAKHLLDIASGVYASANYLKENDTPQTPQDLKSHRLLHKSDGQNWLFKRGNQRELLQTKKALQANDASVLAELVENSYGIALLPELTGLIQPHWQKLLPDWQVESVPLYAIYYKNRGLAPTVRTFVNFLSKIAKN